MPRRKVKKIKRKLKDAGPPFDAAFDMSYYEGRVRGREQTFQAIADICVGCQTVLDVGGGAGMLKRFLNNGTRLDVVDLSPKAMKLGVSLFPDVGFTTGSIRDILKEYDAVVALSVVEHVDSWQDFIQSVWDKANRIVAITFRSLSNQENKRHFKGCARYWENTYVLPKVIDWVKTELHPLGMEVKEVKVDRPYSPEVILVLYKALRDDNPVFPHDVPGGNLQDVELTGLGQEEMEDFVDDSDVGSIVRPRKASNLLSCGCGSHGFAKVHCDRFNRLRNGGLDDFWGDFIWHRQSPFGIGLNFILSKNIGKSKEKVCRKFTSTL